MSKDNLIQSKGAIFVGSYLMLKGLCQYVKFTQYKQHLKKYQNGHFFLCATCNRALIVMFGNFFLKLALMLVV